MWLDNYQLVRRHMAFKKQFKGDQGNKPSYTGSLKGDYLNGMAEFLANAVEAGVTVRVSLFKNSGGDNKPDVSIALSCKVGDNWEKGPTFGLFKAEARDGAPKGQFKKPNPFKKKDPEEAPDKAPDGEDIPF